MKKTILVITFLLLSALGTTPMYAQDSTNIKKIEHADNKQNKQHRANDFVDLDGDGFNDNAPDHDGDGIPNGLDPDYQGPGKTKRFIDLDGDGIDDNLMSPVSGQRGKGKGIGPKNGQMGEQKEKGMPHKEAGSKGNRKRGSGNN